MSDHCRFVAADSKQIVHEIAAPLFARHTTGELHACGTATVIGRGYAITAAHVVDDYLQKFGKQLEHNGSDQWNFDLLLYLTLNEGADLLPMKVLKLMFGDSTDIALLWLGVPDEWPEEQHTWKVPRIQLLPPPIGDFISGFGFSEPEITQAEGEIPIFDAKPRTTTGKVIEIHHERRDSVRLSFPCFRVDARFDGSMSGGPVFSSSGNLCGIVCSSLPADDECDEHVSYVASLWPMLGFLIEHDPGDGRERSVHTLSEFFDGGHFFAVDRDRVEVQHQPGEPPSVIARVAR